MNDKELMDFYDSAAELAVYGASIKPRSAAGIFVTALVAQPEFGWPIAYYCPICRTTTFLLHPWAVKPTHGDYYWFMAVCPDNPAHSMRMRP